ncbi:HSP20 family protein [Dehalogenimonas formicexedens]|uniref:HSP20 family protein n=1 Tax=Dehalogenimonas formicexedens TaxID=1839801 RepID=A0A1P8F6E9_9CHLR|nr:Hsp20/alpha crystallin family protein [Dehalogenimonas formicexedens]APV44005.1 HSP20 family protein [Dehalogenimonas formicexedens]
MAMERWQSRHPLAVWQPFRALDQIEKEFDDIFGRSFWPITGGDGGRAEEMMPKMDIFEKEDKYVVKAEVPGIKAEDIDISITGDLLTLKGEKKDESETHEEDFYRRELSYGSFVRSIRLPSSIDVDKISASCDDGILEISLPKAGAVTPKKIATTSKKSEKGGGKVIEAKAKESKPVAKKQNQSK